MTGPGDVAMDKEALTASPGQGRRRALLIIAGGAGLLSAGGMAGAFFVRSPEQQRAEASPPTRTTLTSPVERRVLASTVVTRGLVGAARQIEATPSAAQGAGIVVVTAVRTKVGSTIRAGQVLLAVSGRPLIALAGVLPAYRDMRPGDSGDDVRQLQAALAALGHPTGPDRKGYFGSGTKRSVRELYGRAGFTPADTGGPGGRGDKAALRAAEDAVSHAAQALAEAQSRLSAGQGTTAEVQTAKAVLARARDDRAELIATTGPMVPMAEVVFLPDFPATVVRLTAKVGDVVTAPLVTLAAGQLGVAARIAPDQGDVLRTGMAVEITSETLGTRARGVLESLGEVTTDSGAGQAAIPYVPAWVKPDEPLASKWNGLDVRLTITSAQTQGKVMVVPISAISAGSDGRTTVTVLQSDRRTRRVEVRAGVSGDGYVEVTPVNGELAEGEDVVVGE
ncbi:MAG: peptidoglycan-binding protein [Catenulispora sp.]|nr:peptidoglycan-binding protein [Catenulispora sp.]